MNPRVEKFFSEREMPRNFIRFYAVGLMLFIVPSTREIFINLIGPSLLLVITAILLYQRKWNVRMIIWFTFIALTSFLVEMFGVNSGDIFGSYGYGRALGVKVNSTPVIIGLNWLFLVYATRDIAAKRFHSPFSRVVVGSTLMVLYDLLLEVVAPPMEMWSFAGIFPPPANFISWFVLALVYHSGCEALGILSDNRPARMLFLIQGCFFIVLGLYSVLFLNRFLA